jgi:hypothetical protein
MNNNSIHNKVEETLNSLDSIKRAEPTPFFYTRLMARMSRVESGWEKFSGFIARPAVALAGIFMVVMINAVAIYSNANTVSSENELTPTEEYTQVATNFYDMENIKP